MESFPEEGRPENVKIRVSIEWSGKRGSQPPGPTINSASFSKSAPVSRDGTVVFDQVYCRYST